MHSLFFEKMAVIRQKLQSLMEHVQSTLKENPHIRESLIDRETAVSLLNDPEATADDLLPIAGQVRAHFHRNSVLVHILNNIRNGNCAEDCGYCAQRRTADGVPTYTTKPEEEIMEEARAAKHNGAYRYCLVTAGRGTSARMAEKYAKIISRINTELDMKVCLSAGLIQDPEAARILAEAGLDRYNHNLNTAESHYSEIATTHTYQDRLTTLDHISSNGVSLCSGVIAGLGESRADLVSVAFELNRLGAASIPVNFFLPVDGNVISHPESLSTNDCLKILSIFRLINPSSELRMAAGREVYLADRQKDGLRVANSLFVSGYLNVKGSSAEQTIRLIYDNGYCLDDACESQIKSLRDQMMAEAGAKLNASIQQSPSPDLQMKSIDELRPFQDHHS